MKITDIFLFPVTAWLLLSPAGCKAQSMKPADFGIKSKKALDLYLQAREMDKIRDYGAGVELYKQAAGLEPGFAEAYYNMGIDLYNLLRFQEGLPVILKAADLMKDESPILKYYIAELSFHNQKYADAVPHYKDFIAAEKDLAGMVGPRLLVQMMGVARENLRNSSFAAEAITKPVQFDPINLGTAINSIGDEYLPKMTADEEILFITSRRAECTGGYDAYLRDFPEDFFYSEKKNGEWQQVQNLGPPVNTELNEGAASFTPDGQWVYFTACNRDGAYESCDLYVSKLTGKKWSTPENLGPLVNTDVWESQPFISDDGNTLYFVSTRPGGLGGHDIWFSRKVNGYWAQPENLGAPVNSAGNEYSPFLHADGESFYFSSNGHPGFGGIDLFRSEMSASGWGTPQNLGYPLNLAGDEQTIFINTAGTDAYISSNREGSVGRYDIFKFTLDEKIRPKFTTWVRGFVLDSTTGSPLAATISFVDLETGDTIRRVNTNSATGKFLLTLPLNREYAAHVESPGHLFRSEHFSLQDMAVDSDRYFDLLIKLNEMKSGTEIVLRNIFFESGSFDLMPSSVPELNLMINFIKAYPAGNFEVEGHTDNVGTAEDNLVLSQNRANEVRKYLIANGISEKRVTAKGYGESKPMAENTSDAGRSKNRRTVLRVI